VRDREEHAQTTRHARPEAKDKFGLPVASVHYDDHPNDVAMRNHAYKQGAAVYEAVGATVYLSDHAVIPAPTIWAPTA